MHLQDIGINKITMMGKEKKDVVEIEVNKVGVQRNRYFHNLLINKKRYLIVYGGAGSGKSYFIAQKWVFRLIREPNHRFLFCRKFATSLKNSVFKLFLEVINTLGIEFRKGFIINKTDKTIRYLPKNGEIIFTGLDDPEKLKSIAGITSIWIEEATEIEEDDFDQLDLRLRGRTSSYKQIIITFNPTDERHWIKKRFIDDLQPDLVSEYTVHHSTVRDNEFIDKKYRGVLEAKAASNPNYYRIYALGEWGKPEVKSPFAQNFDEQKHLTNDDTPLPGCPLRFSFDFNVDPFVCLVLQMQGNDKHCVAVKFLREIGIKNGDVYKMAQTIKSLYTPIQLSMALFTGDAMQKKKEISQENNRTAWEILKTELNISEHRLNVLNTNPLITNSWHQVNSILQLHPNFKIHKSMKMLINDLLRVEIDEEGKINKSNRKNLDQRADYLDAFRYALNTWMRKYV